MKLDYKFIIINLMIQQFFFFLFFSIRFYLKIRARKEFQFAPVDRRLLLRNNKHRRKSKGGFGRSERLVKARPRSWRRRHYHGGQRECKRALVAVTPRQNVGPLRHSTARARYEPVSRAITFSLLPPSWNGTPGWSATIADCEWGSVTHSRRLAAIETTQSSY